MEIIDGRKISKNILGEIKAEVAKLAFVPQFTDICVGEDFASKKYVEMKARLAEEAGIKFVPANFPSTITTDELVAEVKKLNQIPNMCGIIVQLPLPDSIDKRRVLDAIDPALDVDSLGSARSEAFYHGDISMAFPTALAVLQVLESIGGDLKDKKIAVLGQGELVGKPTTALLRFLGYRPTPIDSNTDDKENILKNVDVIISGIGRDKYVKGEMIKEGAILIDAGTSESNGSLAGDVDRESVSARAAYLSPVPGGVGPVTVAMLLGNVLKVAKNKNA